MIIVREVFTAKPGMASKLAKMFKDSQVAMPGANIRVLTDAIAEFNTVVLETEFESMTAFEKRMEEYRSNTELHKAMTGYADMYLTGRREIFRILE
jgi:hypothetical protein